MLTIKRNDKLTAIFSVPVGLDGHVILSGFQRQLLECILITVHHIVEVGVDVASGRVNMQDD